ncbi:hypothetical protein AXG93_2062s1150 [Marchantia polymorpha subsp. ruderalis]|uniref:C-terminal of Roc (COR) domain-containing protein n=1 Tax=Marchantia polymorpha subsp. ruderalis TaxID=1480154 RepID=A0A176VDZ8_MARPO|nr:hypothetical protein AXG93_2062s1150 [Marchantia polymorpha subsp. ruderalis]
MDALEAYGECVTEERLEAEPAWSRDIVAAIIGASARRYVQLLALQLGLRFNHSVMALSLARQPLGAAGFQHVADMLLVNGSLQHLNLRRTGLLTAGDGSHVMRRILDSLVLARNALGRPEFQALGAMLAVNRSLEELDLSACGMVAEDLAENPDLLAHGDGQPVAQLLGVATSLHELDLSETGLNEQGQALAMISLALRSNTSLRKLNLGGNCVFKDDGGKFLGDMLGLNSGLRELGLSGCTSRAGAWRDDESMDALAAGPQLNCALERLDFSRNAPRPQLFHSLGANDTLTSLNLELCDFDRGPSVEAILALLRRNCSLTSLRLDTCTGLEDTDLARIRLQLETNAASQCVSTKRLLLSLPSAPPSSARVVLCGAPFAGKLEKLSRVRAMVLQVRKLSDFLRKKGWHRRMRWGARKPAALESTSGVEIQMLEDDRGASVALWDVAGHEDVPSFHENVLASCRAGGATVAFVVVCNLCRAQDGQELESLKSAADVADECEFWFKLLASTTRLRPRPRVFVALNRKVASKKRTSRALIDAVSATLARLRTQFEPYLDVVLREKDAVEVLDAWSAPAVSPFFQTVLKSTLDVAVDSRKPPVPVAAEDLNVAITKWMLRHSSRPIITWHKFHKLCLVSGIEDFGSGGASKDDDDAAQIEERCRAVASFMHDAGQIVFFPELEVVVISPRWFFHCLLGRLAGAGATLERGLATGAKLYDVFCDTLDEFSKRKQDKLRVILPEAKLIQLLLRSELCFESTSDPDPDSRLFCVPAALPLDEFWITDCGSRRLGWPAVPPSELDRPLRHLGRRLACRDQVCTFLTPGFFPRLQVSPRALPPSQFPVEFSAMNCRPSHPSRRLSTFREIVRARSFQPEATSILGHPGETLRRISLSDSGSGFWVSGADAVNFIDFGVLSKIDASVDFLCALGKLWWTMCRCPQVHLHNQFLKLGGFERAKYRVERSLISVSHGGVDYLIEYSPFDHFVDILVRHPGDSSETLALVQQNVVGPIQEFCASPGGCQGVDLVEGVIRTSSVERLDLCQHRRSQSASLSELVRELQVHGSEHRHRWPEDAEGREDSEYIVLLLGKEDLQSQADKWARGLEHAALKLGLDSTEQQDSPRTEPDDEHDHVKGLSADLREALSQMLGSERRAFLSITRRIDRLKGWQERILEHLSSRLNELNPFTAQLHECDLPRLAYFTVTVLTGVTETRQIVAEMSSGLTAGVQVHYMCEAQGEGKPHIVPKQLGRNVSLTPESLKRWWPYLAGALSVLDVMVKAGAEKLISSASIPTFSVRPYWNDKLFWDGVGNPGTSAPQWLVDFFMGPGPQRIYDDFMLHKVYYEESEQVAWICDDHMRRGKECGILGHLAA